MKKILIIEDDPVLGHIYRSRLENEGYHVEIAIDGQSGYYGIAQMRPDAVLLDLMLPKMNGVEVLKKTRAQSQFHRLPIIVFTNAYSFSSMVEDAVSAGATAVFNKSAHTPRQILDALNNALNEAAGILPAPSEPAPAPTLPAPRPATVAVVSPAAPALPVSAVDDTAFQTTLLRGFAAAAPQTIYELRKQLQAFTRAAGEEERAQQLFELYRKVHALTGNAGIAGCRPVATMAAALEAMLKEMHEKPKNITPSAVRTTAHAVDFLGELFLTEVPVDLAEMPPINVLVVDDDILSRRAVTFALEKAFIQPVTVDNPHPALQLARETAFDLVLLDVQMPGMDGFQLCAAIRASERNKTTPVIFVTSQNDFKIRAQSTLSGGNDFIAKPFMFIELTVKALTTALRHRMQKRKKV